MKWEYKGRKLASPHVILWRVFWFIPFKVFAAITCLIAWLAFGRYAAEDIWDATK